MRRVIADVLVQLEYRAVARRVRRAALLALLAEELRAELLGSRDICHADVCALGHRRRTVAVEHHDLARLLARGRHWRRARWRRPLHRRGAAVLVLAAVLGALTCASPVFIALLLVVAPAEDIVLGGCEPIQDDLRVFELDASVVRHVARHARQLALPDAQERIDRAFADLETWQVRQKVVTDKEDEEDPVVDRTLEVERERRIRRVQLDREVLAQRGHVEKDERLLCRLALRYYLVGCLAVRRKVAVLAAAVARAAALVLRKDVFTQHLEVWLVRRERQHDQVSIEAVDYVAHIRVMVRIAALPADVVHDLVLALAGDGRVREHDSEVAPSRVRVHLVCNPVAQRRREQVHKRRPWRDRIRVPRALDDLVLWRESAALAFLELALELIVVNLGVLRRAEASAALLVHLGAWRNAVDSHH